jgi:hypothetical protein
MVQLAVLAAAVQRVAPPILETEGQEIPLQQARHKETMAQMVKLFLLIAAAEAAALVRPETPMEQGKVEMAQHLLFLVLRLLMPVVVAAEQMTLQQ